MQAPTCMSSTGVATVGCPTGCLICSRCRRTLPAQRGVTQRSSPVQDPPANTTACDEASHSKNSEVVGDVPRRATEEVGQCRGGGRLFEKREDLGTSRAE